jgi:hypothetical protein
VNTEVGSGETSAAPSSLKSPLTPPTSESKNSFSASVLPEEKGAAKEVDVGAQDKEEEEEVSFLPMVYMYRHKYPYIFSYMYRYIYIFTYIHTYIYIQMNERIRIHLYE